ncbi:MAG: zinc-finger domain-containing protein [Neisseria sp.]|nr:zinc-finger domain-containing protein [Neisseria sp.]
MSAPEIIMLTAEDLPVFCPPAGKSLWDQHPRVFLPLDKHGECRCPYCGAHYRLHGESKGQHA